VPLGQSQCRVGERGCGATGWDRRSRPRIARVDLPESTLIYAGGPSHGLGGTHYLPQIGKRLHGRHIDLTGPARSLCPLIPTDVSFELLPRQATCRSR